MATHTHIFASKIPWTEEPGELQSKGSQSDITEKLSLHTEDAIVGWHLRLNGHEFGWTPAVGDGQGVLACCSPWGYKELDVIERLNRTESCSSSPLKISQWSDHSPHLSSILDLSESLFSFQKHKVDPSPPPLPLPPVGFVSLPDTRWGCTSQVRFSRVHGK